VGSPNVSLVIPTYQRRASLIRALAALRTQTISPAGYEVIVVIDGSTDGTVEAVRHLETPYRLRTIEQTNQGRAAARNAGIGAAAGEVIVFLDDDMEASAGLLEAHWCAHAGLGRRAVVGAAPIVLAPGAPPLVRYKARGFDWRLGTLGSPGYRLRFRDVYAGNLSIRREVLLEVGVFDEAFSIYGHEDYELALRLDQAGVELVFSPQAVAHQHYEKTFAALARDGIARGRTAMLLAGKHPEVAEQLKLGTFERETQKWRALRSSLLALTRLFPITSRLVIIFMGWLEGRRPTRLDRYYTMALDYFYWVGAQAAMRGTSDARRRVTG
jgi:glycosyltransferase involved in cell wall biosynthesis